MSLTGGCECGAIRYRLAGPPIVTNFCHCRDCQGITGSAFAINAMIEGDRIVVTQGSPERRRLERPGQGATHAWRCATCDSLLWADHPLFGDRARFVRVGTLDLAEALPPDVHYFVRSRHPWLATPAGVPEFATLPQDGAGIDLGPERTARLAAMFGASEPT